MSDEIKPAMSAEEWQRKQSRDAWINPEDGQLYVGDDEWEWRPVIAQDRHALAALALHGRPFGFTREDVTLLREAADVSASARALLNLTDRIAALLPPEGNDGTR